MYEVVLNPGCGPYHFLARHTRTVELKGKAGTEEKEEIDELLVEFTKAKIVEARQMGNISTTV